MYIFCKLFTIRLDKLDLINGLNRRMNYLMVTGDVFVIKKFYRIPNYKKHDGAFYFRTILRDIRN
jgi:hypothetical protein